MARQTWDEYFLDICHVVAQRSTCSRRTVGAVIVHDHCIIATGYNGSIAGEPHCEDVGCLEIEGKCVRTIHAERNALNQSARYHNIPKGSQLYCTDEPCWGCFKDLVNAGITRIVYSKTYGDKHPIDRQLILDVARRLGIFVEWHPQERDKAKSIKRNGDDC